MGFSRCWRAPLSGPEHDLWCRRAPVHQIPERFRTLRQRPLLDPIQFTQGTAVEFRQRGTKIGRCISIGTDECDLRKRQLARVELAGLIRKTNVHDYPTRSHRSYCRGPCRFCADYVYDEIEALFADLRVGWIKYFGASSSLRRAATQRVGLTKRHPPASFVSQQ